VVAEADATVILLLRGTGIDHGAHGAVHDEDATVEEFFQQAAGGDVRGSQHESSRFPESGQGQK
jgi:hypothetical protein